MKLKQVLDEKLGINRVKENEPLAAFTTYKIGGPAEYFFKALSSDELIKAINVAKDLGILVTVIGGGTNILISDKGIKGLVIRNESNKLNIHKRMGKIINGKSVTHGVLLEVDSGVSMNRLVRYTCDEGFQGLESHLGLPGTVGGALYTNSKWTQTSAYVGDSVYKATIIDSSGKIKTVDRDYFHFDYDFSILQKTHETIVSVLFYLKGDNSKKLWQVANQAMEYRKKTQPTGVKSAGCVFRNISVSDTMRLGTPKHTTSTGHLLDQVGMKKVSIGKAGFSNIHANFIINNNGATAKDIYELIKEAKKRIILKYGIHLELEIVLLGKFN